MEKQLREKLWDYIAANNPDLMFSLQEGYKVMQYLEDKITCVRPIIEQLRAEGKPDLIIAELCMAQLTEDLRPSRYLYIKSILDEEFQPFEATNREAGTLTYEILNLITSCKSIFEHFGFSKDSEDNRFMRYAVIGQIHSYMNGEDTVGE